MAPQLEKSKITLHQKAFAIARHYKVTSGGPVAPVMIVYKATAVASALYGAEIWGYADRLTKTENRFLKTLFKLTQSTPVTPICLDLALNPIHLIAVLKPLLYWVRLWPTQEQIFYRECVKDLLALGSKVKTPWIKHIQELTYRIGMSNLWTAPDSIVREDIVRVKQCYWEAFIHQTWEVYETNTITGKFLNHKSLPRLEPYMNRMHLHQLKTLHVQYRCGILPLRSHTTKWTNASPKSNFCPNCPNIVETESYFMLFCPYYRTAKTNGCWQYVIV